MCFVWISEQTATSALYCINGLVFITDVESVYCAVGIESLYNADTIRLQRVNKKLPVKEFSPNVEVEQVLTFC